MDGAQENQAARQRRASAIVDAIKRLSQLNDVQTLAIQKALATDNFTFAACRRIARTLQAEQARSEPKQEWTPSNVSEFLSALSALQSSLEGLDKDNESLQNNLYELFDFAGFDTTQLYNLSEDELDKLQKMFFPEVGFESAELNLINGISDSTISISLKTVFTAEGEIKFLIPIATLKISAQSTDGESYMSIFQLTKQDIEKLTQQLTEVTQRITSLETTNS